MQDLPTKATVAARELRHGLFTTALEGGINYWAECALYHWSNDDGTEDYEGYEAIIIECEEMESVVSPPASLPREARRAAILNQAGVHHVNDRTMARGYKLATSKAWRDKLAWSTGRPPFIVTPDTDWDYDAGDADMILQLGLFGEVVYG